MATTTPNMGLLIPAVNDSDYPTSVSNSLTTLDSHNHSSGSGTQISTGGIANNSISAVKIIDGAVTNGKLATDSVTVTKISDGSVQTAKIADVNVTGPKIAVNAVENTKIANGAVSQSKMGAVNFNQSASSGLFSTASTSYVDVVSTTLTPNNRIVIVSMEHDGGGGQAQFVIEGSGNIQLVVRVLRDATVISEQIMGGGTTVGGSQFYFPVSSVWCTDRAPGTVNVTYKLQVRIAGAGAVLGYVLAARISASEIF